MSLLLVELTGLEYLNDHWQECAKGCFIFCYFWPSRN
jgi:hypothetical protein